MSSYWNLLFHKVNHFIQALWILEEALINYVLLKCLANISGFIGNLHSRKTKGTRGTFFSYCYYSMSNKWALLLTYYQHRQHCTYQGYLREHYPYKVNSFRIEISLQYNFTLQPSLTKTKSRRVLNNFIGRIKKPDVRKTRCKAISIQPNTEHFS